MYLNRIQINVILCAIWNHLHNLKNVKKNERMLQFATLLKVTLLHGSFSRFFSRSVTWAPLARFLLKARLSDITILSRLEIRQKDSLTKD